LAVLTIKRIRQKRAEGKRPVPARCCFIRRTVGAAPVRKKAATSDIVIAMAAEGRSLRGLRNRAVLLLGFAGAFRRSELVALNVEDIEETPEGLLIIIRRGKTDQEGLGRKVAIPRGDIACPVEAVQAWREAAGISQGALFRRVWNKRAQRVGAQRHHGDRRSREDQRVLRRPRPAAHPAGPRYP
jgi:integrase